MGRVEGKLKRLNPAQAKIAPSLSADSLRADTRIVPYSAVRYLAILPVFAAVSLGGCKEEAGPAQRQAAAAPPIPVGVVQVAKRATNPGQTFIGRVEAVDNVNLIARVEEFLRQRSYEEGQVVKKGDLLFVLEKANYQAQLDAAEANLAKAQADADNAKQQADRARVLVRQQATSEAVLDDRIAQEKQTAAVVAQVRASLEQAKINLGYTEIRAPFTGRIGRAAYSVGALVGPSSGTLASIVSQDPIYVSFPVSDRTILEFTRGERATATTEGVAVRLTLSTGMTYPEPGVIDYTGLKVDPNTDTLSVRAKFPNPKGTLVDGQFVRVLTESKEPVEALVIPQKAVLTDQGGNFVLLVDTEKRAVQRRISTAQTIGSDIVVSTGLKEGETIMVDGLQRVRPGQAVDPAPSAPAPSAIPPKQPTQPARK